LEEQLTALTAVLAAVVALQAPPLVLEALVRLVPLGRALMVGTRCQQGVFPVAVAVEQAQQEVLRPERVLLRAQMGVLV
jgi:hypothetical protein